jgi:hypothetical protein
VHLARCQLHTYISIHFLSPVTISVQFAAVLAGQSDQEQAKVARGGESYMRYFHKKQNLKVLNSAIHLFCFISCLYA